MKFLHTLALLVALLAALTACQAESRQQVRALAEETTTTTNLEELAAATGHSDGDKDHDHDHEGEDHDEEHDHEHGDEHDHDEDSEFSEAAAAVGDSDDKPWGKVVLAALLINLVTLIGVFVLTGEFIAKRCFGRDIKDSPHYVKFTYNIVPSFACGALMATTVYLVLPEALYLITSHFNSEEHGEDHDDHGDHEGHDHRFLEGEEDHEEHGEEGPPIWRFGTCIIGGFLLPALTSLIFSHSKAPEPEEVCKSILNTTHTTTMAKLNEASVDDLSEGKKSTEGSHEGSSDSTEEDKEINYPLVATIMAGDFFHNFADGVFVGTAFLLCSSDLAVTIAAATVYHELAQEVADYFMLTRFCNLAPPMALFLNFINGLSVLLGAIIILAAEELSTLAVGSILAVSGGVYIYISVVECYMRAQAFQKERNDKLVGFIAFVMGVVPIGLVLLNHQHCEAAHDH